MPVFRLHCNVVTIPSLKRVFLYDSENSSLTDESGKPLILPDRPRDNWMTVPRVSKEHPGKKAKLRKIKIQLGLSCNYACTYCSQRFVPHAEATAMRDIEPFLANLPTWFMPGDGDGFVVEMWGGEPLAYWKVLKPLSEEIRRRYPKIQLRIITNGSLMDMEKVEWLDRMGFIVGVSHDGPGQHVRGPDPLDDPPVREALLELYRRLRPQDRMSFNTVLNRENISRSAIQKFFVDLTGDPQCPIGEGTFVDAYDEGGLSTSLRANEAVTYRRQFMGELRAGTATNFNTVNNKITGFIDQCRSQKPKSVIGQKCGMDREDTAAIDLKGNVLTCQNVSAVAKAPNGEKHKTGSVFDLDQVAMTSATHWSFRPDCGNCPVLHLCQGSCMFLENELWRASCDNAYSDNVVPLCAAVEAVTGFLPYRIEHELLPPERQWLWQDPPKENP